MEDKCFSDLFPVLQNNWAKGGDDDMASVVR
jgi:hypothetical protein